MLVLDTLLSTRDFSPRRSAMHPSRAVCATALGVVAMLASSATAQRSSGAFSSYYGTDAAIAAYEDSSSRDSYRSSRNDPPYQSHFGATRPAGHFASAAPDDYELGMDADSLYAAGAAAGGFQTLPMNPYAGNPYAGNPYAGQNFATPSFAAPAYAPQMYYYLLPVGANNPAPSPSQAETAQPATDPTSISTVAALAPGANWQIDYANFQDDTEELETVPPLPSDAEQNGDDAPTGEATGPDGAPRFGQEQQQIVAEIAESPLQFLRAQSVLLDRGERQIDIGMQYAVADGLSLNTFQGQAPPPADDTVLLTGRVRQRLLIVPIEFRYGLTDNIQVFCNIPFGWANSEVAVTGVFDEWSNRAGIGDVSCGATALLHEGCGYGPDVLGTFAFTAPTGQADFFVTGGTPNSRLGEGFWAVSSQLLVIHTLDPCVLFYGLGYRHRFDDNFQLGVRANPGEQFIYQLGMGFAANEKVTLSTSFLGLYVTEDEVNGRRVQGGITEPMRLRFSATIAKPCKIVEPFAEIGMTRDAANSRIGITWTY